MTTIEIYRTMIESASRDLAESVDSIPAAQFGDRPVPGANPASFIYFHVLRHWDRDINLYCRGQAPDADAWHRGGFSDLTGYAPLGIGAQGLGTGYGYTADEVSQVPTDKDALTRYHAMLQDETHALLDSIDAGGIEDPIEHSSGRTITVGGRLRHLIAHTYLHIGDIEYVKGLIGAPSTDVPNIA